MQYHINPRLISLFEQCIRKSKNTPKRAESISLNTARFNKLLTKKDKEVLKTYPYPPNVLFLLWYRGTTSFNLFRCVVCGKELSLNAIIRGTPYCGHKCSNSTEEFKQKRLKTNLERYGVSDPCKNSTINEKRKRTNVEKYGVCDPCQNEEIDKKRRNSNMERYGVSTPCESKEINEKKLLTNRINYYPKFLEGTKAKRFECLDSYEDYCNNSTLHFKCLRCGTIFESESINRRHIHCPYCIRRIGVSDVENDIRNIIKLLVPNEEIVSHNRTILGGFELDIFVPNKRIAIEYNGGFWHNEENVGTTTHQTKSSKCYEKGIRLIHIFEHEWVLNKSLVIDNIRRALGVDIRTIPASQCTFKTISRESYTDFVKSNRFKLPKINGDLVGIESNNELVGVFNIVDNTIHSITVKRLLRIDNLRDLFSSYFKNLPIRIKIDFGNEDWKELEENQFKLESISDPSFVYYNTSSITSKYYYYTTINPNQEKIPKEPFLIENIENEGGLEKRRKVWDSGIATFVLE